MKVLIAFLLFFSLNSHGKEAGLPADSLYQIPSAWTDQSGKPVDFKLWRGSPVILAMAYSGCTYTCPLVVNKLKEIEAALVALGAGDFKIVLASFDTEGDRPADLLKYMKAKKVESGRWSMMSAKKDKTVRELAALLGVTYSRISKTDFSHSNQITLLDREGRIAVQINGISADHAPILKALAPKQARHEP